MRMYTRAKRKRFHHKIESQMFLFISGRHIGVHPMYTNMGSPYKALKRCMERLGKYPVTQKRCTTQT